jgi:hypothetical protein
MKKIKEIMQLFEYFLLNAMKKEENKGNTQVTIFMSFWCAVEILLTSTFRQKKIEKSNIVWTSMLSAQRSSFGHEKITSILSHENEVWIYYLGMKLKPRLIMFITKIYKTLP